MARVFDQDRAAGITRYWHYNDELDEYTIETVQDVQPIVDANKRAYNAEDKHYKGELHRVASLPLSVFFDLKKRGILDDQKAMKKWLNDPDNRYFRTKPGRV